MARSSTKYYVVWDGRLPGIYNTWEQCKDQVEGYVGAKYKAFPTLMAAQKAFLTNYPQTPSKAQQTAIPISGMPSFTAKPIYPSLAVDAAWNTATGVMEYRGVDAESGREIFRKGPFADGTNNIGEFLAVVHGLALLAQKSSTLPIYTDSNTAISWVRRRKANTKQELTGANSTLFNLIERAEKWLQSNTWQNPILKWETRVWGEIPADFGRK